MSISILNRGASGGLKPELTVIAPSGSTIDLLQNGTVVKTYTLGADETEHTFVVKIGTYTVRGILGSRAKEAEVLIDHVGRYRTEIDYRYYIVQDGAIQNGLEFEVSYYNYNTSCSGSVAYDPLYLYRKGSSETMLKLKTAVDLSGYSTLNAILSSVTTNYANNSRFHVGVADEGGTVLESIQHKIAASTSEPIAVALEITADNGRPCIWLQATTVATIGSATVKDFWLE